MKVYNHDLESYIKMKSKYDESDEDSDEDASDESSNHENSNYNEPITTIEEVKQILRPIAEGLYNCLVPKFAST